jgi:hypothetical protein
MTAPARMRYETFTLGGEEVGDGVVHLRSRLPEVIALGIDSAREFMNSTPPLGGPHATWVIDAGGGGLPSTLVVETPECSFQYTVAGVKRDVAGWYFVMRRTYVSDTYHAWVETL